MNEHIYECQTTKSIVDTQKCVKHNLYDPGVYSTLEEIIMNIMKTVQV